MTRTVAILALVLGLGACGADGEPVQPTAKANVTLTPKGVRVGTGGRIGRGPLSIGLGTVL